MALTKEQLRYLRKACACKCKSKQLCLLKAGGPGLQRCVREIAVNVLKGRVPLNKAQTRRLKRHREDVRALARKGSSNRQRLRIEQKGGFLASLIAPLLGGLASTVLGLFKR